MTFFYDLNKKLDSIREKPETTHQQLNERDMSRAAKGYEKYGKEGMEALAKAGREGKALDPIRAKYDKYDESVEEGSTGDYSAKKARAGKDIGKPGKQFAKIAKSAGERYGSKERGEKVAGAVLNKLRHPKEDVEEGIEDRLKDLDPKNPVNIPAYQRKAAEQGRKVGEEAGAIGDRHEGFPRFSGGKPAPKIPKSHEGFPRLSGDTTADKKKGFADKIAGAKKEVDEMLGDVAAEAIKGALSPKQKKIDMNKNGRLDANDFEMLRKGAKAPQAKVSQHSTLKPVSNPKSGWSGQVPNDKEETDESWDDMIKDAERRRAGMKTGEKIKGHKGEIEKTATGIRHTRSYDPKTGETDIGDDDKASGEKRGRGRPKGSRAAIGAKGPSGKSKLMTKEADNDSAEVKHAMAVLKKAGYKVEKAEEELDEKAVSKAQQRFMGMVHATQKGEKAPSKEVAQVAKSMKKSDAEDFAATKHKGLPEKKKPEGKKKEKTEEAGGAGTPTASSGFSFGKGIYDSMNHELETMIAESMTRLDESMNVSMNMNTDANGGPSKSLTVTATDDDAAKLGQLLKMAGLGGGDDHSPNLPHIEGGADMDHPGAIEVHGTMDADGAEQLADKIRQAMGDDHGNEPCPDCGHADCECDHEEMDEAYGDNAVDENNPDYPTNTEYSADALQYSGGLNKPKTDVAGDGQTTIPNTAVHTQAEDELRRLREMAGLDQNNRLDEGIINKLKDFLVPKLIKLLGPDAESVANAVRQATGGDLTPNKENAAKVVQALGIDKAAGRGQSQMAEGIAGNWQGKLIQALYTLGLLGTAGAGASMWGTLGGTYAGAVGFLLLMAASSVFGDAPGQVGAMGKFGNKKTSSQQGTDIHGMPVRNLNVDEGDDLARMMEMAGVKEAKKVDEDDVEEGNKFTGNLAKARADGKKEADLDGDGDLEKVRESVNSLWKEYKGQYGV